MDDDKQSTPGAPELDSAVKPPSAPLVEDKHTGPVFRAEPTMPAEQPVSVDTSSVAAFDDDDEDDDGPEAPPALDEHQARIEYLQSLRQNNPKKKNKREFKRILLATFLILVIVGAVAVGVYFFFHSSRPPKPVAKTTGTAQTPTTTQQQPTQTTDQTADTTDKTATTAEPKDYNSTVFGLTLSYPGDWTPAEVTGKLTITSPVVTLTSGGGQTTSGKIILTVRPRQDKPAEFASGKVVAVLPSDKVNYTKPASTQRATTFISYLQYAATTVKGGLDGIYITGNYGYKYAQTVQLSEISKVDPLIDVTFVSCADTTCATATQKPLTLSSAAWKTDTTNRPIVETMLKSLVLN